MNNSKSDGRRLGWLSAAIIGWLAAVGACTADRRCIGPAGLCIQGPSAASGGEPGSEQGADGELTEGDPIHPHFAGAGGTKVTGRCDATKFEASLPLEVAKWFTNIQFPNGSDAELLRLSDCIDPTGKGVCYAFEWTPHRLGKVTGAWRLPDFSRPLCVEPGATTVYFRTWSDPPGEIVRFGALLGNRPLKTYRLGGSYMALDLTGIDYNQEETDQGVQTGLYFEWQAGDSLTPGTTRHLYVSAIEWIALSDVSQQCKPPAALGERCGDQSVKVGGSGAPSGSCDSPEQSLGAAPLLIDDFEDGDDQALPLPNGHAFWTAFNDGNPGVKQYPSPCTRPTHLQGLSTAVTNGGYSRADDGWALGNTGSALVTYACSFSSGNIGLRLVTRAGGIGCDAAFDASQYDGIRFRARSSLPFVVQIATADTSRIAEGGNCQDEELDAPVGNTLATSCLHPFESSELFAGEWRTTSIPFKGGLRQASQRSALDTATIRSIDWKLVSSGQGGVASFAFAIDDVELYKQ